MVTATTGMDALSHAVEAVTKHTYNTPLEDKLAKDAVGLIYHNLLTVYRDGNNLEARQNMQRASFLPAEPSPEAASGMSMRWVTPWAVFMVLPMVWP